MLILVLYLAPSCHSDVIGSWLTGLRNGAALLSTSHIFWGKISLCCRGWDQCTACLDQLRVLNRIFSLSNYVNINNSFTVRCEWNSHQHFKGVWTSHPPPDHLTDPEAGSTECLVSWQGCTSASGNSCFSAILNSFQKCLRRKNCKKGQW